MKILDIIESLDPAAGGPQHSVRALSGIWRSMGHTVDILTLDAPNAPYLSPDLGVTAIGQKRGRTRPNAGGPSFSLLDMPRAIASTSKIVGTYDVVLVHGLWNYVTLLARCVLARQKVPYFVFIHGMLDPWHKKAYPFKDLVKRALWPFNENVLLSNARAALFTTKLEVELADGGYQPYRLNPELIQYGCAGPDPAQAEQYRAVFHAQMPELRDKTFLLFMSRIHPKKGCDILLRAFAACQNEAPDLHLVIAGPDQIGSQQDLQRLADDLGIAGKVHWPGSITGALKWGALSACDAFILPSHGENFGIVVAEAMACARPVLISDRVNLHDTVSDWSAGIVAPDDLPGTIGLIRQFVGMSAEDQTRMAHNALACYHANYGIEAAANAMIETFSAQLSAQARARD